MEFNSYDSWSNIADDIKDAQSRGFRTFAASNDNPVTATVQNHLDLYADGIDVTYTYNLANAVVARMQVNGERGISPP
ncbi:hypothetical protein EON65_47500 [archaeon]|nr:MAG: hypothetical protein EON65_47500 [archaeon]